MAEPVNIGGVNYDRYMGHWDQDVPTLIGTYGGGIQGPVGATITDNIWRTAKIGPRWVLVTPQHKVWWMRGMYKAFLVTNHPDNLGIWQGGGAAGSYSYTPAGAPNKIPFPNAASYGALARYQVRTPTQNPKWEMYAHESRRLRSWHVNCLGEDAVFEAKGGNASTSAATTVFNAGLYPSSGGLGKNWWGGDHVANSSGQWSNPEGHVYYHFTQGGLYAGGKPLIAGNDPVKIVYQHTPPSIPSTLSTRIFMDVFDPQFLQHCLAYGAITTGSDFAAFVQVDDGDYCYGLGHGHRNETGFLNMSSDADTRVSPHLGYLFLVSNPFPTQQNGGIPGSNAAPLPIVFQAKNQKMFTKLFIRDQLFTKYGGSISALNAAWGSNYTTFDSAGGWKVGSGLLDEDGRTSHTWLGNGTEPAKDARWIDSTKWSPGAKIDLDNMLYEITKKYFSDIRQGVTRNGTLKKMYAGHSYVVTWGYPCRKPVIKAAAEILDIIPSAQANEPEAVYEYLAANGADRPFINWMLAVARIDSGLYYLGASGYSNQPARAQFFINSNNRAINYKNTAHGTYQYVGYHWFEQFDKRAESGAWGFQTRRWNPLDGRDYASAHKLPDSLPGVAGSVYPTLAEDGPAYATTDPGLPYKVYGDFITPVSNYNKSIPTILATQFSGAPPPPDTTPPTQPGALSGQQGSTTLLISWSASTDNVAVAGYKIGRRATAIGGPFVQVGTTAQLSFQDTGLAPSTSYDYSVTAYDTATPTPNDSVSRQGTFSTAAITLTRVTENFNGPDNATNVGVQQTWTSMFAGSGFGVTSNQARLQGIPGAQPATHRMEVNSVGQNQFIEATLARETGASSMAGLCLRMTSTSADRYSAQVVTQSADLLTVPQIIIRKELAGGGGTASAAPTVVSRTDGHTSASTTAPSISVPAGSVGDLIVFMIGTRNTTAMTWPAGWTSPTGGARTSGVIRAEIRWRIADGTEGTTLAVSGASSQWTFRSWRISGHDGTGIAISGGQGNTANPDPPNLGVPWGTKPTLWIVGVVRDNKGVPNSAYPATYTDAQHYGECGGTSLWCCHASAEKTATAPSDDPGPWTWAADEWIEYTMAVGPLSGPVAPLVTVDRAVAVGSRLRFEAETISSTNTALRLFDDGVLVAAGNDTGAGTLTGLRGGITGTMSASTNEVAFDDVVFGDIDQSSGTPQDPVVTIQTITSPVSGVVSVTADFTDPNGVGGVRSELYVDGILDSVREPLVGLTTTHQWNTLAGEDGVHILRMDVIDGAGALGSSSGTTVTVSNQLQRRVQVSGASLSVPDPVVATRRVQVSHAEFSVPNAPANTSSTWTQTTRWRRDPNASGYHVYLDDVDLGTVPQPAEGEQPTYTFTFQGTDVEVIFGWASILPGPVLSRRTSRRERYRQTPVVDLVGPTGIELLPPSFSA